MEEIGTEGDLKIWLLLPLSEETEEAQSSMKKVRKIA
ncbi:hypothetical protein T11_9464 [Trichinella zimbabwensis]|uniref:Uncharacterized protein n=1 Tax=Trichinella zimbabwensis TaxID=268475 RepID=A0A0V1GLE7_9BILA|nr:hypothetical protein T11_9464 [Trichinella zimbabwensis]